MKTLKDARLLRIYVAENERIHNIPLHEAVVKAAREAGLSGATVLRGIIGYGSHREIHTTKILSLALDLPVVIEIVDLPEKIDRFLPILEEIVPEGLVTLESVKMIRYSRNNKPG